MSITFEPYISANVDRHPHFGLGGCEQVMSVNILGQEIRIASYTKICPVAYDSMSHYALASEYMLGANHCMSVFMAQAAESIFFHSADRYKRLRNTLWLAACPPAFAYAAHLLRLNGVDVIERYDVDTALESIVFQGNDSEAKVMILELRRAEGRIENDEEGLIL